MPAPVLRLSVLDQAPVPSGSTPGEALANAVSLAEHVDRLGYHRLWYSEHHAMPMLAGAAPELLIARAGAATSRIRIGSGGIMLPHYAALKVAELFRTLDGFYPGRIDLGIGRAPGGGQLESHALRRNRTAPQPDDFPQQLGELLAFLHPEIEDAAFPANHPFRGIHVSPAAAAAEGPGLRAQGSGSRAQGSGAKAQGPFGKGVQQRGTSVAEETSGPWALAPEPSLTPEPSPAPGPSLAPEPSLAPGPSLSPDVWLLGSSMWSSATAAANGLPYAFAHFFSGNTTRHAIEHYQSNFQPSPWRKTPEATIAIGVICADTQAEADRLALSVKLLQRRIRQNDRRPVATPDEAALELGLQPQSPHPLLAFTQGSLDEPDTEFPRYIVGTPDKVRDDLLHIARELELRELIVNTITHSHEARLRSYSLLAEAFGLG